MPQGNTYTIRKNHKVPPSYALVVVDDRACGYLFRWCGDLAMWEYSKVTYDMFGLERYYPITAKGSLYELISHIFDDVAWLDRAIIESHDYIPADMAKGFPYGGVSGDLLYWWEESFIGS